MQNRRSFTFHVRPGDQMFATQNFDCAYGCLVLSYHAMQVALRYQDTLHMHVQHTGRRLTLSSEGQFASTSFDR
jgi:hypothetical protein